MAGSTVFPAFITDTYRAGTGFAEFERSAAAAGDRVRKRFESDFSDVGRVISASLGRGLTGVGSIDLGVGQFQQAAREARAYAESVRTVTGAAVNLARATGDTSESTRIYLQSLRAQVVEADHAVAAANAQSLSYERLQGELNRTANSATAASAAFRELYRNQIEAANAEVAARMAQAGVNGQLGVGRAPKSASVSAGVFQEAHEAERAWEALALAEQNVSRSAQLAERSLIDAGKAAQSAFSVGNSAIEQFEANLRSVADLTERALSTPRNANGSFNLNVGGARESAAAAQAQAIAAREVATALERVARAEGDTSQATQQAITAARAHAVAAEEDARAINGEVVMLEKLQTELNGTASRTTQVITGQRNLRNAVNDNTFSARANRFAYVQLGQQLQDVVIQAQMGVNPFVILVQQGTQAAFAMSNFGGKVGTVARFLAGPWGTAVFIAVAALGSFATSMKGASDATDVATTGADALGKAQGVLGEMFDLTSGKLEHQNSLLLLNARYTALSLRVEAQAKRASSNDILNAAGRHSAFDDLGAYITPLRGSTPGSRVAYGQFADAQLRAYVDAIRNPVAAKGQSIDDARTAAMDKALRETEKFNFGGRGVSKKDFQQALLDVATAERNDAIAAQIDKTLNSGSLSPVFRKKGRDHSRQTANLNEFGNDALDRANAVAGRFEDQPKAVEQARKAYAELDNIQRDLIRKNDELIKVSGKPIANFAEVTAAIGKARETVASGVIRQLVEPFENMPKKFDEATAALNALDDMAARSGSHLAEIAAGEATIRAGLAKPLTDYIEQQSRQAQIQDALNAGHEDEAALLQAKFALMQQVGAEDEAQLARYLAAIGYQGDINDYLQRQVELVREQGRAYEELQARIAPYLNTLGEIQRNIQQTIEGALNGRNLFASGKSLITGLKQQFNSLLSQTITEKLFGGIFRDLRDQVQGRNPVQAAGERMATAMDGGSTSVTGFADAVTTATANIQQAAERLASLPTAVAANDNLVGPTGQLPVLGRIPKGGSFADHLARGSAGLDIAAALGTAIKAPASGKVLDVGYDSRSGYFIRVDHGGGIVSSYAHMARPASLLAGAGVSAGDILGAIGLTGNTTGPHLHYRVKTNGSDVDPATFKFPEISTAAAGASKNLQSLIETVGGLSDAANDAGDEIVVTGHRLKDGAVNFAKLVGVVKNAASGGSGGQLSPAAFFATTMQKLSTQLARGIGIDAKSAEKIGGVIGKIAGAVPQIQAAMALTTGVSKILGIRNHAGGLFGVGGNLLINSFTSPPTGRSTIRPDGSGNLYSTISGNSAKYREAVGGASDSTMSNIARIADALGATITGVGAVSIGLRNGTYRVDPTGQGKVKTKKGAIDVGSDITAAVQLATLNLIQDGILGGLRAGTQRLLAGAKDLDSGISKALQFEGVFTTLKQYLDPVGAAVDALNKQFEGLKTVFAEAGASAEDYAKLQQLYDLQRAEAIQQAQTQASTTLKDLLSDLTTGNDAFSLRDRLAGARAKYDPLAAEVGAGNLAHVDAFAEAARAVEQIQRQLDGSQPGYFDFIGSLTDIINKGIDAQAAAAGAGSGTLPASPFAPATPAGTDGTVTAIDQLGDYLGGILSGQLNAVNDNLGTIIRIGLQGGGGASDIARQNF